MGFATSLVLRLPMLVLSREIRVDRYFWASVALAIDVLFLFVMHSKLMEVVRKVVAK